MFPVVQEKRDTPNTRQAWKTNLCDDWPTLYATDKKCEI